MATDPGSEREGFKGDVGAIVMVGLIAFCLAHLAFDVIQVLVEMFQGW